MLRIVMAGHSRRTASLPFACVTAIDVLPHGTKNVEARHDGNVLSRKSDPLNCSEDTLCRI